MDISHIRKPSAVAFARTSGFCSAAAVARPIHTRARHTPLGPGVRILNLRPRGPRRHPIFFKNRVSDIEIDPKSIYVHTSRPRPDRPPSKIVKNHQKSSKFQRFLYFSKLLRRGSSSIVTERSKMCKILIFGRCLQFEIQLRRTGSGHPIDRKIRMEFYFKPMGPRGGGIAASGPHIHIYCTLCAF